MGNEDYEITPFDNTVPPPWLHEPMEKLKARIVAVVPGDGKYGPDFQFHFHVNGDDTGDVIWYTTGRSPSPKNKLGRLSATVYGDLKSAPTDVREFIGKPIEIMFEHVSPATSEDSWKEKIIAIASRKLTKAEAGEDAVIHELANDEAPF